MFVKLLCGSVAAHSVRLARWKSLLVPSAPTAVAKRWVSSDRMKVALEELLQAVKEEKKELDDEEDEAPPTKESIPTDLRSIRDSIARIAEDMLPRSSGVITVDDIQTDIKASFNGLEKLWRVQVALKHLDQVKLPTDVYFKKDTGKNDSFYWPDVGPSDFRSLIKMCLLAFWKRRAIKLPKKLYLLEECQAFKHKDRDTAERLRQEKQARRALARVVADNLVNILGDEVQVLSVDEDDCFVLCFQEDFKGVEECDI